MPWTSRSCSTTSSELTITGLALGAIYGLVALGYTMVYGVLQLINFAHSEVFMFGTFAVAWVVVFFHGTDVGRPEPRAAPSGSWGSPWSRRCSRPPPSRCCSNAWPTAR